MAKNVILLEEEKEQLEQRLNVLADLNVQYLDDRTKASKEGDLSENFAYEQANKNLQDVKREVDQINDTLNHATVLKDGDIDRSRVSIGVKVTLKDTDSGKSYTFVFVDTGRGSLSNKRISNESIIGRAIEGSKQGDVIQMTDNRGNHKQYMIESLE